MVEKYCPAEKENCERFFYDTQAPSGATPCCNLSGRSIAEFTRCPYPDKKQPVYLKKFDKLFDLLIERSRGFRWFNETIDSNDKNGFLEILKAAGYKDDL